MKLRHTTTALALASCALALPLAGCTSPGQQSPAEPSREVSLRIAPAVDPTGQALAHVYGDALENLGYTITFTEPSADPFALVADEEADLAIDTAPAAISLLPAGSDPRGEDQVLSADEAKKLPGLINDAGLGFSAATPSEGTAGQTLVLAAAQAVEHSIDSLATLAAACGELSVVTDSAPTAGLRTALEQAGCAEPSFRTVDTEQLHDELRSAVDRVVVLQAQDAVIGDEGFKTIDGSEKLFDAALYLPLAGPAVDRDALDGINEVTRTVNTDALIGLNRIVSGEEAMSPQDAAARWRWIIDN
ncbi:glycine betaine ABC transporter substrate-binding protein [Glutamicibacter sp. NPDC087344]|uniref:glycine betaine ABC transporter substrate-binding protein n=1 Tax=Glutamicibacter sp. NPDC087344 TaxID=3363994 RepID=UPI0037F87BFB